MARPADLSGYRDAHQVSAYAVEPLGWAVKAGLLQGTAEGDLLPQGGALRGQTAVILWRFFGTAGGIRPPAKQIGRANAPARWVIFTQRSRSCSSP